MVDIADIFSSKARIKVLRSIDDYGAPLPLRHIAYLAECPVFSVQRALQQLVDEKILVKKTGKQTLFSLNANHDAYPLLTGIFALERQSRIRSSSKRHHARAQGTLEFSCSAHRLIQEARP